MVDDVTYIVWKEEFSVGVESLDAQHKQVISILNKLYDEFQIGFEPYIKKNILTKLNIFTETHFHYEETILRITEYPEYEEHKKYHTFMKDKTKIITAEILSSDHGYHELLKIITDWWINHILITDMKYSNFLSPYEL